MITVLLITITSFISYYAFSNRRLFHKFMFNAYQVHHRKEWYRLFSHGFIHANWEHLIVNMLVFYSFGQALEMYFRLFLGSSTFYFLFLYIGAIVVSSSYSLVKQKDNYAYNAVGASGAVSAVTFACVFFAPMQKIYLFMLIPIPGIVFAALYLGYSYYMSKKNQDNIGHDAHFYGAIFGFFFPLLFNPSLIHVFFEGLFF